MRRGVPYLPPYYISTMPQNMQEEIREKLPHTPFDRHIERVV